MTKKMHIDVSGSQTQEAYAQEQVEAGHVSIHMKDQPGDETIRISGSHSGHLSYDGSLSILAKGRNGRHGKIGADGRDGSPGFNGRSATSIIPGSNGGPGEDGTDGKPGTHGENAGDGGSIEITVQDDDRALLDAVVETTVSAGTPGHAGRHGRAGKGGRGGYGGSSYTWYESYPHCHYHHHHRDGYWRTMPGGLPGPNGRDGRSPTHPLYPGKKGENGTIKIHTINGSTTTTHQKRYQFSLKWANPINVVEFGSQIHAAYQVANPSQSMSTPAEVAPLRVSHNESIALIQEGEVKGDIAAQQAVLSHKDVVFNITHPTKATSEPHRKEIPIEVHAVNTRLKRDYQQESAKDVILAEYPVSLQAEEAHLTAVHNQPFHLKALANQKSYTNNDNPTVTARPSSRAKRGISLI